MGNPLLNNANRARSNADAWDWVEGFLEIVSSLLEAGLEHLL